MSCRGTISSGLSHDILLFIIAVQLMQILKCLLQTYRFKIQSVSNGLSLTI